MFKKTIDTVSAKNAELRRKALILGGTAVGIIAAYAYLSKSNDANPESAQFEAEAAEIIAESKANAQK